METLEIIIGLVFTFLLLSLLATTLQEIVATLISMRGRVLVKALAKLLEIENLQDTTNKAQKQALASFKNILKSSQVFQKYTSKFLGRTQLPSYLSSEQVSNIIRELMDQQLKSRSTDSGNSSRDFLFHLKDEELRYNLEVLAYTEPVVRSLEDDPLPVKLQADEMLEKAKENFKKIYDEIMDRASGWYKRNVQRNLIIIGLLMAFAFDADTFKMYEHLSRMSDSQREKIIQAAVDFSDQNRLALYTAVPSDTLEGTVPLDSLHLTVDSLLRKELQSLRSPLGLGRPNGIQFSPPPNIKDPWIWRIQKFFGWMLTAIAISMGAPFWFDLLQRLIRIRNSGKRPEEKTKTQGNTT